MTLRRPWRALLLAVALLGLTAAVLAWRQSRPLALPDRPPTERPTLMLLTSLPLAFSDQFSLDQRGSPVLASLERRYAVVPIGVADAASLHGRRMLLMAHPRAQPAEALVDLDRWIRQGGRLLLLADPRLDHGGDRPLGDKFRPPPFFADTGLLDHWGLSLSEGGGTEGVLSAKAPHCTVRQHGMVARCRLGRGVATVIADADFLMSEDGEGEHPGLLISELATLETL